MFTFKTLVLLFSIASYINCQTISSDNKQQELYDWNLSVTGGLTRQIDDRMPKYTLNYFEFSAGYLVTPHHEIGINVGKNYFLGNTLGIRQISFYNNGDTTVEYGIIPTVYENVWFTLYYKFNYYSWFAEIAAGRLLDGSDGYTSFSAGKEFNLSKLFFINLGLNYAINTNHILEYKYVNDKQLTLTIGFSIKL